MTNPNQNDLKEINVQRINKITSILQSSLNPEHLQIIDDSHKHHGHPGAQSGAGHFTLIISSLEFRNKTRLECHRLINNLLKDLFINDIHAMRIKIIDTPA
jgi:BolA family transcriptional regulator, general stress-responsive regulator